ncbi:MAG: alkaline phosphatase D family protein [Myxococcota bacterium]|nr:alkaline phosphatase D family protein [Myxococcota bacterium]
MINLPELWARKNFVVMAGSVDRRTVLKGIAATTFAFATGCASDDRERSGVTLPKVDTSTDLQVERFPLGVQAGAMTHESVILWSYSNDGGGHAFALWPEGEDPESNAHMAELTPIDGYLKLRVDGLSPSPWYVYGVVTDDQVWSPLGRVRTAHGAHEIRPVLVCATACTAAGRAPLPSLDFLADQSLDVFCHRGDMSDNDGATTTTDFRSAWAKTQALPEYQALLSSVGYYQTWDDHEMTDNEMLPNLPPDILARGIDAYFETTPTDRHEDGHWWTSYRWGRSVEFFVLDCRREREPATRQYISRASMDWLKSALAESPCHFNVV